MAIVKRIVPVGPRKTYDILNVPGQNLFFANGLAAHNSRFLKPGGSVAGMTFMISSKRSTASFLEKVIADAKDDIANGYTYLSEYSIWEVKDKRLFTAPKFKVEVGDRIFPSRIIQAEDEPRMGARIVKVPGEFKADFERNVDQALRDMAGIATFGTTPLFRDKQGILAAVDANLTHPFTREQFSLTFGNDEHAHSLLVPERLFRIRNSARVMLANPTAPRFYHLDLGVTEDAVGFAMGHVAGMKKYPRIRPDGTLFDDFQPVMQIDLMLRVPPPKNGATDFSKIRTLLINLRDMGVPICAGSCDGFQSVDMIQILTKLKFDVKRISVDASDEPYLMLRQSFDERRMLMYQYAPVIDELCELEHDLDTRKVDHPVKRENGEKGRKDVADALCGVVWHCMTDIRANRRVSEVLPGYRALSDDALNNRIRMTATQGSIPWSSVDKDRRIVRRIK